MIVDASVLLHAFLPDELQPNALALVGEHVAGRLHLATPALLPYELSNAVWQAERRGRLSPDQAGRVIDAFRDLDIEIVPQPLGEMLPLARQYNLSAYDAAYLSLAQTRGENLVTGDQRLFNAVKDALDFVIWIGDYAVGA
jgi:predicted nucleic acid-binding protein